MHHGRARARRVRVGFSSGAPAAPRLAVEFRGQIRTAIKNKTHTGQPLAEPQGHPKKIAFCVFVAFYVFLCVIMMFYVILNAFWSTLEHPQRTPRMGSLFYCGALAVLNCSRNSVARGAQ